MSDRIDRLAGAGFRSPLGESAEGLQQPRGSWQGESVEVAPRDATSLLADAKEELAMAALAIRLWEEETGQEYFTPETRKDKERKAR